MEYLEFLEIAGIAVALSVDAFSISVSLGCGAPDRAGIIRTSLTFGFFQFFMPVLGWLVGIYISDYFGGINYISAAILLLVAGKMVWDARHSEEECLPPEYTKGIKLLTLAVASSIDAFGVGILLATMTTPIYVSAAVIGVVCGVLSFTGLRIGCAVHKVAGTKALYFAAVVLTAIAIKTAIS